MLIQSLSASFSIQKAPDSKGCLEVRCDNQIELSRLFGSLRVEASGDFEFPYQVIACKQEYADAMILLIKEIDYFNFSAIKV
ncbi:hypothetical protein [Algoriphagus namhaensis]